VALAGAVIAKAPVAPPPRRGACGARRLAELALSGGAGIADEAASGPQHMIILTKTWLSHVLAEVSCISLFLSLTALAELALAGAVIAKVPVALPPRRGACGAAASQRRLASAQVKVIKETKVELAVLQLY